MMSNINKMGIHCSKKKEITIITPNDLTNLIKEFANPLTFGHLIMDEKEYVAVVEMAGKGWMFTVPIKAGDFDPKSIDAHCDVDQLVSSELEFLDENTKDGMYFNYKCSVGYLTIYV